MDYFIEGSSVKHGTSPGAHSDQATNTGSMDGDEFCRITIDSLTNSYKIGSPVKPAIENARQTRSISHSLFTTVYMEGKKKIEI